MGFQNTTEHFISYMNYHHKNISMLTRRDIRIDILIYIYIGFFINLRQIESLDMFNIYE